jgi:hypothetical protein
MVQGKHLEQQVSTSRQRQSDRRDSRHDVTHGAHHGDLPCQRQWFCPDAILAKDSLDHVIVANEAGLQRVLSDYLAYHLHSRTHLALDKDPPISRSIAPPSVGPVVATPQVGGLHHRYDRVAA